MEKEMDGMQATMWIVRGAAAFSIGMAWLSNDFEKTFTEIWAGLGMMISAAAIVEVVVVTIGTIGIWIWKRYCE
jgi:hypothetical protein